MSQQIEVVAELRKDVGKGASRRLRRADQRVPGIIYGSVVVEGDAQQAVLRDIQRHPASEKIQHIDFLRVSADQEIDVHVPLHFVNEDKCVGVKQGGGTITHNMNEVEVRCLPKDLPEFIEVDVANVNVGESVHLSDLSLPAGVVSVELIHGEDHDASVVSVLSPRGGAVVDETDEEGEGGAESAEG